MARIIKVTDQFVEGMLGELVNAIRNARMTDGKFTFQKSFDSIDRRAELKFTEIAWLKMQTLIQNFDKEVAWHGVVLRGDNDEYIVKDILVYPQKVEAATVESDDEKYPLWYGQLVDQPEVFNNLRLQGHSHVNMGVTPSSTDLAYYKELLADVPEDSFYVFIIMNKKGDKTIKIYDFVSNILFETADVDVSIIDEGHGLDQFLKDAKDFVKPAVHNTQPKYNYGNYNNNGYSQQPSSYAWTAPGYAPSKNSPAKKDTKYKAGFYTAIDYDDF